MNSIGISDNTSSKIHPKPASSKITNPKITKIQTEYTQNQNNQKIQAEQTKSSTIRIQAKYTQTPKNHIPSHTNPKQVQSRSPDHPSSHNQLMSKSHHPLRCVIDWFPVLCSRAVSNPTRDQLPPPHLNPSNSNRHTCHGMHSTASGIPF